MNITPFGLIKTHVPQGGECPDCYEKLDAASNRTGNKPEPGDCSVCAFCGCLLRFTETLELRRATDIEIENLEPEQRQTLLNYQTFFRSIRTLLQKPDSPDLLIIEAPPADNFD